MKSPFEAYGFEPEKETDNEQVGKCPFCGKSKHFYVNKSTRLWACHRCGKEGNVYNFLTYVVTMYRKQTKLRHFRRLEKLRGIPAKALMSWGICYDQENDRYLLPYFSANGLVRDIRSWYPKSKRIRSTPGCELQLYGLDRLDEHTKTIYLCEGEWDTIAFSTVVGNCVLGVPGANTFKKSWVPFFAGKHVVVMFDNDNAGRKGAEKVKSLLGDHVEILEWSEDHDEGYDVRDWLIDSEYKIDTTTITTKTVHTMENVTSLEEVKEEIGKICYLNEDLSLGLEVVYAVTLANNLPGDPLWSYIVGPPGCGKTMLLMSLSKCDQCLVYSDISPKSLVSGWPSTKGDPSLLPYWNRQCVVFKDFTEILATHHQSREELYSVLRGAYDGYVRRSFGNGIIREYKDLRFSLVAGVTPAIHADPQATMGERFLKYEVRAVGDKTQHVMAAISTLADPEGVTNKLADISASFLNGFVVDDLPDIPEKWAWRIAYLAQVVGYARAVVARDRSANERLVYMPSAEIGTRLAKQLFRMAQLFCLLRRRKMQRSVYRSVCKIAFDSMTSYNRVLLCKLIGVDEGGATMLELVQATSIPRSTLSRALDDLQLLEVVEVTKELRSGGAGRPSNVYRLSEWYRDLWNKSEIGGA